MDFQQTPTYPKMRFSNIGSVVSAGGVLTQIKHTSGGRYSAAGQDGDRIFLDFVCTGAETLLEITSRKESNKGIWDLYVNDVLDSAGYDDYSATPADVNREIILANPVQVGRNTVELRVNGKNVSSIEYFVQVRGASLQ